MKKNCIAKNGEAILSLKDWLRLGAPKGGERQWKAGRSAMETARAWLGTGPYADEMPHEILNCITSHEDFSNVVAWNAEPEVQLRFDSYRGEPRNTDLAVEGKDASGEFFMGVEAKADESFDQTLDKALKTAQTAKILNTRSKATDRINELSQKILGKDAQDCSDIHYQLLTATAGVVAETRKRNLTRGVLMIHEFVTDETEDAKHEKNQLALDTFVASLGGIWKNIKAGALVGPIHFESTDDIDDWSEVAFYIGKARRYLRKRSC